MAVPVAPAPPSTPCYVPWLELARALCELGGKLCGWLAAVLPGLLTTIYTNIGPCCAAGGTIAKAAFELAMQKRVWVPMAICGAVGISVYAIHAVWYHNALHIVARCVVVALTVYLYKDCGIISGAFQRGSTVELYLFAEHLMIVYARRPPPPHRVTTAALLLPFKLT